MQLEFGVFFCSPLTMSELNDHQFYGVPRGRVRLIVYGIFESKWLCNSDHSSCFVAIERNEKEKHRRFKAFWLIVTTTQAHGAHIRKFVIERSVFKFVWQKYSKSQHSFAYRRSVFLVSFWLNLIPLNHFHSFRNIHKLVGHNDRKEIVAVLVN